MAHLTDLDLTAPADSLFSGGTVLNTWRTRIDALNDVLGDITTAEANQVENIAATTISAAQWAYVGALNQGLTTTSTVTFGTINAFTLGGKLTAGAVEIEGSAFDINGGTVDGITSLTAGGNLDIGAHGFTANTLTADGLTPGRLVRAGTGGLLGNATVTESSGALGGITTLSMNNQLTNSLADGTAPFVITSTTKVSNLNVERVDGAHASSTPTASYIVIADASGFLHTPSSAPDANYEVANKKYVDDNAGGASTFLGLTDSPAGYTTNGAIYVADNSNTQIDESTVILTESTNTFAITKGSASLDIAVGATLNIDVGLQVTTNAGTLAFSAATKTLTVEDDSNINQDLSSDASPTFAGLALGAGNITMSGSIGVTGTRVTKGWFTAIEITNAAGLTIGGTGIGSIYAAVAQTMYIGTTQVAINRSSAALTLAGITLTTPDIGTPSAGTLTNCSFPTLNQNTTGSAATLTTARTIGGVSFDGSANIVPNTITIADESADTTCFVGYFTGATGALQPKTGTNLTFNSNTGILTATGFAGNVTGNVTGSSGSCTGEAATVATITGLAPDTATTQATQGSITSIANLATIGTVTSGTLSTGAVLAGVTMTLGSDVDGDIYIRSSNVLTRIGAGTEGHVLTMGASLPAWAAAAGAGANTALSNLASVAINLSLTSDTDITDDLGTAAIRWKDIYAATIGTGDTATDTLLLRARDVDGSSWTTFMTLTAGNTPTCDLATGVTIGTAYIYRAGGTDVPVADGGTGSSTAGNARAALGVAIGSDVLAYDAGLSNLAGIAMAADKFYYTSGDNTHVAATVTSFARTILDDANAAAVLGTLGLSTNLPSLTDVEVNQLELIGTTTISATQWGYLGGCSAILSNIVEDTSPQLGGELDCQAHTIGFTQQTATGDGTTTIDWTIGNKFYFTFGAQNDTFTFTAPTHECNLLLVIKQDGTGSRLATWPNTVMWPGGTAPTLSTAANAVDVVSFYWDGTSYHGVSNLNFS